jgi:hypothetical protein
MLLRNSPAQPPRNKRIRRARFVEYPRRHGLLMRFASAVLLLAVSASPALAQRAPVIVIPGKPGVPVLMNGVDVSWSVIEGEFGLDRPGQVTPTVIYGPYAVLAAGVPYYAPQYSEPSYFPSTGRRPGYGRLEVVPPPNRPLPRPAPTYFRNWSSESAPGPATEYTPFTEMPAYVSGGGWRHHWHDGRENAPHGRGDEGPQHPNHDRR